MSSANQETARCSFCGETRALDAELVEGGGEQAGGLPVVQLCRDCAQACLDALHTERRIGEARASTPPRANEAKDPDEVGELVAWTPFNMDGRALEWSARRTLNIARTPLKVMSVRSKSGARVATVLLEGDTPANLARAIDATVWLRQAGPSDAAAAGMGPLGDWQAFSVDGEALEWRAERVEAVRAGLVVSVHVRNPATGRSVAVQLDGKAQPGIDDAVMAAATSPDVLEADGPTDDAEHPSRRFERDPKR